SPGVNIRFQVDNNLEGEIWYHSILIVIVSLAKPESDRPKGILVVRNSAGFIYENKNSNLKRSFSERTSQRPIVQVQEK
ncbi:hypothetical protein ABTI56_19250, partial [Acinetobacter baumannii]